MTAWGEWRGFCRVCLGTLSHLHAEENRERVLGGLLLSKVGNHFFRILADLRKTFPRHFNFTTNDVPVKRLEGILKIFDFRLALLLSHFLSP